MIELKTVSAGYQNHPVIQDISLSIPRNSIFTLIGPNGCGKSTLLKTMARLISFQSGEIYLNGQFLPDIPRRELAKKMAILPQNRDIPGITVENLTLHGRFPYLGLSRIPSKKDRQMADAAMDLTGVTHLRNRDLRELSGGERQKAYLSMVIAQDADLILLDEPTTHLDIGYQFDLLELIQKLNQKGKTIVMVLHELSHALEYSDRIAVMEHGRLLNTDTPANIFHSGLLNKVFHVTGHIAQNETGQSYYFTS